MKHILAIIGTFIMVTGCMHRPTAAGYQDELSSWVGQSEDALYAEWGYPNTTYSTGDDSFVATYIQRYNEPIDGDTEPYADEMTYSAMKVPSFGLPTPQGIYYCKTSFVIQNGIVTDFNFNGDDCVR